MAADLIAFAKAPVPGAVKTRLAATIGPRDAADFYKACASHIFLQQASCWEARCSVACASAADQEPIQAWLRSLGLDVKMTTSCQVDSPDLGERMTAAIRSALFSGSQKVIIIGTDIPGLSTDIIRAAYQLLDTYEVVLGPAADGGYYLIGVARWIPDGLLRGISWSTDTVFESTVTNAKRLGLSAAPAAALPVLQDIDTFQDLQEWHTALQWQDSDSDYSRSFQGLLQVVARLLEPHAP